MIKDIFRLKYQGGLSHERIARSLSISKGVVAKYLGLAGAAGLDWQATAELDEGALERRLLGRSAAEDRLVEANFAQVHVELRRKGVTLVLLWQEYRAANEGRRTWAYTQFCEHYKAFAKTLKRSMRQQAHRASPPPTKTSKTKIKGPRIALWHRDLQPLPTLELATTLKPSSSLQSLPRNPASPPNRSRSRNHRSRSPKYAFALKSVGRRRRGNGQSGACLDEVPLVLNRKQHGITDARFFDNQPERRRQ
ncbi:MAG: hypothetical protein ABI379_10755 [Rhodanobacter sp.]